MKKIIILAFIAALGLIQTVYAAGVIYEDGDKYVKFGGRIQIQYLMTDPDSGDSTDTLFFRRLRPYIEGSVNKDWVGKFQWDMGKAEDGNELAVKAAYLQYKGNKNMTVTFGNQTFPFSREQLTSSKKQQLVERTFTGDHNYGSVDRQLGLYLDGNSDIKSRWSLALASAAIDPDNKKLDFDTVVNKNSDFNEGWMFGARWDYGGVKNEQTNFNGNDQWGFALAAFSWSNDGDNNVLDTSSVGSKTPVDTVSGLEISTAYRKGSFSLDAEFNSFDAELLISPMAAAEAYDLSQGDPIGTASFSNGIYDANGKTTLQALSIEGGILSSSKKGEFIIGYQTLDADGYAETWGRTSLGYNKYIKKHDIKISFSYRMNENQDGSLANDVNEFFIQTQYVF